METNQRDNKNEDPSIQVEILPSPVDDKDETGHDERQENSTQQERLHVILDKEADRLRNKYKYVCMTQSLQSIHKYLPAC